MVQLQRWTQPTATGDVSPHAGEWVGLGQQESYEAALWAAHLGHWRPPKPSEVTSKDSEVNKGEDHEVIPKARVGVSLGLILRTSLGLTPELGPGPTLEVNLGIMQEPTVKAAIMVTYGADGPLPRRRVSFHNPNDVKDPVKEEANCLMEPSIDDLEMWLEFQAGQLGTPTWWEELGAVPSIEDRHKLVWKIRASFYVLEVWLRVSPEWGYTAAPAPWILDGGAFHPEKFAYWDVRQWPVLLTIAYARCLQHWVKKHNLLRNPDFHPWAESVRELLEKPKSSCLEPKTIFSQVLAPPADEQGALKDPLCPASPLPMKKSSGVPLHPQKSNKRRGTC